MAAMSEPELLRIVEDILEVAPGAIRMDSDLEEAGWDSLSNLNLISILDSRYSLVLDPARLARSETPRDLLAML